VRLLQNNETHETTPAISKDLVMLAAEDRHRMTRLYEEVQTRLEEMALITRRTLNLRPGVSEVKFTPVFAPEQSDFASVEIVATLEGSGYYDYLEGACFLG